MKISVSSYSFQRLLNEGAYNQLTLIKKAKEIGFDAIEFVDLLPPEGVSRENWARQLRAECEACCMEISNYTFAAEFIACENFDEEIARVKKEIDLAHILGAKSVRHDATFNNCGKSFAVCLPILADACRKVTEYAQTLGIRTMVENHGFFCQDSSRVEQLVSTVNHPNFGLLCDMGNFLCADEDPALAFGIVAPFAFYVHAKDFHVKDAEGADPGEGFFKSRSGNYLRGAIIGHGNVPIKSCLAALKRVEYNGMMAIEFEGMEENIPALKIGLENLRRYTREAGL